MIFLGKRPRLPRPPRHPGTHMSSSHGHSQLKVCFLYLYSPGSQKKNSFAISQFLSLFPRLNFRILYLKQAPFPGFFFGSQNFLNFLGASRDIAKSSLRFIIWILTSALSRGEETMLWNTFHVLFLVGGWTNLFEKSARQLGSFPRDRGENKKIFELPPLRFLSIYTCVYFVLTDPSNVPPTEIRVS